MNKLKELYNIIDKELNDHAALLEEAEEYGDTVSIAELHGICGTYQNVLDIIVNLMEDD